MSLCNLHNALRNLARVRIRVKVRVKTAVGFRIRFRSEICKLHTDNFEIAQDILDIVQT